MTSQALRMLLATLFLLAGGTLLGGNGTLSLSPSTIDFGTTVAGLPSLLTRDVSVLNSGTGPLTIQNAAATAPFSVASMSCSGPINPGQQCAITIMFVAPAHNNRQFEGVVTIDDDAAGSPHTVALRATTINPLQVTPASLTFPAQLVETNSGNQYLTLRNVFSEPISWGSDSTGDFFPSGECYNLNPLPAGRSCTIGIAFWPKASGTRAGTFTAYASNNVDNVVQLTGEALPTTEFSADFDLSGAENEGGTFYAYTSTPLVFSARETFPGTTYEWTFGDGSTPQTTAQVLHAYPDSGSYVVTLTVHGRGGGRTATRPLVITRPRHRAARR